MRKSAASSLSIKPSVAAGGRIPAIPIVFYCKEYPYKTLSASSEAESPLLRLKLKKYPFRLTAIHPDMPSGALERAIV